MCKKKDGSIYIKKELKKKGWRERTYVYVYKNWLERYGIHIQTTVQSNPSQPNLTFYTLPYYLTLTYLPTYPTISPLPLPPPKKKDRRTDRHIQAKLHPTFEKKGARPWFVTELNRIYPIYKTHTHTHTHKVWKFIKTTKKPGGGQCKTYLPYTNRKRKKKKKKRARWDAKTSYRMNEWLGTN